jgi:hypothetical protein
MPSGRAFGCAVEKKNSCFLLVQKPCLPHKSYRKLRFLVRRATSSKHSALKCKTRSTSWVTKYTAFQKSLDSTKLLQQDVYCSKVPTEVQNAFVASEGNETADIMRLSLQYIFVHHFYYLYWHNYCFHLACIIFTANITTLMVPDRV